jgi:SAM-dependent methyltransferase
MAALCGMPAPAVATARVLELGSASGGNIIPLACDYPDATIVGVDASSVHIEAGRRTIEALGLRNIELRHSDILDLDASLESFDFIICHGVFSWVAPPVQDKILSIIAESLVPDGIAYISYNTYPGWHLRGIVRDLMQYHTSRDDDPKRRLAEARHVLDAVAGLSAGHAIPHYSALLQNEAHILGGCADYYIFHEHLEGRCEPFYFHEFIRRARGKGLDFLGEAHLTAMGTARLTPAVHRALASLAADTIEREQYLDFICNRTFRETLLCRADRSPSCELPSRVIWPLHIASRLRPPANFVDFTPGATATFTVPPGHRCRPRCHCSRPLCWSWPGTGRRRFRSRGCWQLPRRGWGSPRPTCSGFCWGR